jgi:hypothetical protein
VGETFTLPESCEPLTTLLVEDPAAAVMVTDEAFDACQVSVTLWPLLIDLALAERVMAGATLELPHDAAPHISAIRAPQEIQRNG